MGTTGLLIQIAGKFRSLVCLCACFLLVLLSSETLFCQLAPLDSVKIGGASNVSLQSEGRRRVFRTPSGTWVFYRGSAGISYRHSIDEITWGSEQQIAGTPVTDDFAVAFRAIGGTTYTALAYVVGPSVVFRRGFESAGGVLSLDGASTPYSGNSLIRYLRPAVAISPAGQTVLLVVKEDNPAQKSEFRSVNAISRVSMLDVSGDGWGGSFSLGNASPDLPSIVA